MVRFGNAVHLLALVVWVGAVVFFSLVVAPALFRTLGPAEAGRAVAAIFPTYYAIGTVCGVLLLGVNAWRLGRGAGGRVERRLLWVVGVMLACNLYAAHVVQPRVAALKEHMRGEGEAALAARMEFRSAHGVSMGLNAAVLLGGIALVALSVPRGRDEAESA